MRWGWRELNPRRPSHNVIGHRFRLNHTAKGAVQGLIHLLDSIESPTLSKQELLRVEEKKNIAALLDEFDFMSGIIRRKPNIDPPIPVQLDVNVPVVQVPLHDKPVDVLDMHPSVTASDYNILLSPVLPTTTAVLHLVVSPETGPIAVFPDAPVTYAQMLVSKISTPANPPGIDKKLLDKSPSLSCLSPNFRVLPRDDSKSKPAVDNPINHTAEKFPGHITTLVSADPVLDNRPPIVSTIPALKIIVSGYKSLDPGICANRHRGSVVLSTVEKSWSPVIRNRRRRPLRPLGVPPLPAAPPQLPRPPNIKAPLTL